LVSRKGYPPNVAFRLMKSVFKSTNQKRHIGGIFCDSAEAFDSVNHEILLTKLPFHSIQGSAANGLRSYLTDRRQM
jgi:hypothetical protein